MFRIRMSLVVIGLILLSLAITACTGQAPGADSKNSSNVRQTPITAQVTGESVTVPLESVEKFTNTRFMINNGARRMSFMAYRYAGQMYVRADICPPCGSDSFTLTQGTLVCDSCGTVFDAKTGDGIRGACVKYDKQLVGYEIKDGNIVMKYADMALAYQNTVNPRN